MPKRKKSNISRKLPPVARSTAPILDGDGSGFGIAKFSSPDPLRRPNRQASCRPFCKATAEPIKPHAVDSWGVRAGPGDRFLKSVIAPEQLAILGHETRGAEYFEPLRFGRLGSQSLFDLFVRRARQRLLGQAGGYEGGFDRLGLVDPRALAKFG